MTKKNRTLMTQTRQMNTDFLLFLISANQLNQRVAPATCVPNKRTER
jgi:hypothetical protein